MEHEQTEAYSPTHSFSLKEIASWTTGGTRGWNGKIRASIPALQRGLVWTPQQNELLWDSILRGFPIGAVVLTKWSAKLKKTAEELDGSITHHLLDGQQRCNAIALGFADPFVEQETNCGGAGESILWLDLKPKFEHNSTRNFLVRATTTAHPWGYRKDDEAKPLEAGAIRKAIGVVGLDATDPEYRRPAAKDLWPCKASATTPVPLSWLLQLPLEDERVFWSLLETRAGEATKYPWAAEVHEFSADPEAAEIKSRIFKAIKRAQDAKLVALVASDELLETSEQERASSKDRDDVSNIEQLFQRLNRQGTKLDGEELAYSMIKAYWPDLEPPINQISERRMPQTRMVSLGVRAALAGDSKQNFPGPPTVSALRAIARSELGKKDIIQNFITTDLSGACNIVDHWLKYDPFGNPTGLLPVHMTSIAMNSREIYLLLLHFADRMKAVEAPKGWNKTMQALATLIHWFAPERAKVANRIFDCCRDEVNVANVRRALREATEAAELHTMQSPEAIELFLHLPEIHLKDWKWSTPIHGDGKEEGIQMRRKEWEGVLGFRKKPELLLYAQREFLARRFPEYDPARKDLWEDHNRPWDMDHLLAWKYLYKRGGPYKGICDQWCYTVGNFRAWPFEDNRSDQAYTAAAKIKGDPQRLKDSFLNPEEEAGFSGAYQVKEDEESARLFVETCRRRLLRIYETWYETLNIGELLPGGSESNIVPGESGESLPLSA